MRITPSSSKLALLVILGIIVSTVLIAVITTYIGSQINSS
tara:strand:- start:730 stop:849 length:120 start_codon:yes stop_codon:yes gene_type:complete